jgi:parvulin-like peptidyl-prolyl isomerase
MSLAVVAVVVVSACGHKTNQSDVRARVNGSGVSSEDVTLARVTAHMAGKDLTDSQALEKAIRMQIVRDEAQLLHVNVADTAVTARIAALAKQLGGMDKLTTELASADLSVEQFRRAIADALLSEQLGEAKFPLPSVTQARVRAFYTRNIALFTTAAEAKLGMIVSKQRPIAARIAAQLRTGASFAEMARLHSQDPSSKKQGGMLGWIALTALPQPLAKAIAGLHDGEVSKPVAGLGGWFLLKIYDRRPPKITPYSQVADQIRRELVRRRQAIALQRWVEEARARADVVIISQGGPK